jgi:hypothetical protein
MHFKTAEKRMTAENTLRILMHLAMVGTGSSGSADDSPALRLKMHSLSIHSAVY